jgi:chromosome segregation ATPase
MKFDVLSYLQPRKQAKATALCTLAEQLHAGQAIDPDLILESLEQSGSTEEQLQAEIDRLERVAALRQQVADAVPAQKRLDAIDAEINKAADKMQAAALALQQLREKHFAESDLLQIKIRTAENASTALLETENLSLVQRERLQAIRQQQAEAIAASEEARGELNRAKNAMAVVEEEHPKAKEQAKIYRNTPEVQENFQRWENALAARTKQLAEARATMQRAQDAVDAAEAAETEFRASILGGGAR